MRTQSNQLTHPKTYSMHKGVSRLLGHAASHLSPPCNALILPHAVILDAGGKAGTLVRPISALPVGVEKQFASALIQLQEMIDEADLYGRRLNVVVSDYWSRPLVVPLTGKLPDAVTVEALLTSHFDRIYGDLMDEWHWCWDSQGARLLAVAWPKQGFDGLHTTLALRACRLASARPLGLDVFGALVSKKAKCWLIVISPQTMSLMRCEDGALQDWSVVMESSDGAISLPLHLSREVARRGDDCRNALIVDLYNTATLNQIGNVLSDSGWVINVCSAREAATKLGYRLST